MFAPDISLRAHVNTESASIDVRARPESIATLPCAKSTATSNRSLTPEAEEMALHLASLRSLGMTIASSPASPPHCADFSTSPSDVSQRVTEPWPTTTSMMESLAAGIGDGPEDEVAGAPGAAAVALPTADGSADAPCVPGGDAGDAGATSVEDGVEIVASGTLGPSRIPAMRGQATPTTNPAAAIAPTFRHEG